jgi:ADP-ribose pyrophosphatase YjhB (NUDIX family)
LAREFAEETGLSVEVGALLGVQDLHFTGTAPTGRNEDFHGVYLLFEVVAGPGGPQVAEIDGTTDAVAWIDVADIESGAVPVFELVREALGLQ